MQKLGLITLDIQCQEDIEEIDIDEPVVIPDPIEEVVTEEKEELVVNEPISQEEIREEEDTLETILE